MTAYDAFIEVMDINESIEALKEVNNEKEPNLAVCKITDLLMNYRDLLGDCLKNTEVNCGSSSITE